MGLLKDIYYNFLLLPYKQAKKLPFQIGSRTKIHLEGGHILLNSNRVYRGMIQVGLDYEKCIDTKYSRTAFYVSGEMELTVKTTIGKGTKIVVLPKGRLSIGENFVWTGHSSLRVYRNIKIGSNCLFSWDVLLMDYDGHRIYNSEDVRINDHRPLIIGNNVWIGCRSVIWSGANIPDGCIIGCGSFVKKELSKGSSIYCKDGTWLKGGVHWKM